jgi:hypothetical protein
MCWTHLAQHMGQLRWNYRDGNELYENKAFQIKFIQVSIMLIRALHEISNGIYMSHRKHV